MLKIKSSLKIFKLNLRQTINCILEDNNGNQSIIKCSIITTNLGSMLTCRIRLNVLQKKKCYKSGHSFWQLENFL